MSKNDKIFSDRGKRLLEELLKSTADNESIKIAEQTINDHIIVSLEQHQFDALVMLAYDIGNDKFFDSGIVKIINDSIKKTNRFPGGLEDAWIAACCGKTKDHYLIQWSLYETGSYIKNGLFKAGNNTEYLKQID